MKRKIGRRLGAALLTLVMCLTLLPTAMAAEFSVSITAEHMSNGVLEPIKVGKTEQMKAVSKGFDILSTDYKQVWSSDNEAAVTVSNEGSTVGLITAVAVGKAKITLQIFARTDTALTKELCKADCIVEVVSSNVSSITVDPSELTLEIGPTASQTLTAAVTMDPPNSADEDIFWSSDKESVATVLSTTGKVTGVSPGQAKITAKAGEKTANCFVTVRGLALENNAVTMIAGNSQSITVHPYGLSSIGTYTWTSSSDNIARVDQDNGKITAVAPGECTITVTFDEGTKTYSASCKLTVKDNTAGVIEDSVDASQPLSFDDLESDLNSQCKKVLGRNLSYVTNLFVSPDQGILYYGYVSVNDTGAGVGTQEKYYYSSSEVGRSLEKVTFVPKAGFAGKAVITYAGYDTNGQSFNGEIRVEVEETDDVVYSTGLDVPVTFQTNDFSIVCRAQNGRDMESITFDLPDSKYGTLYYNYTGSGSLGTKVEEKTEYYRTKNPYVDQITFVPTSGKKETVRIDYDGKDTSGFSFSGRITIYVSGSSSSGGSGDIRYDSKSGKKVTFSASDFNDLSRKLNKEYLDYVKFTPPPSSEGTLYYNYDSSSEEKVTSSKRYYRSGTSSISKITFVPKSTFSGTSKIKFVGYDDEGDSFDGVVEIRVRESGGSNSSEDLEYDILVDEILVLDDADLNSYCKDKTGDPLSYIKFSLPSSSKGTLYYDYKESNGTYGSKVSSSTRYYRTKSQYIDRVTFVPKSGTSGTVEIDFDGWSEDNDDFSGTITVNVSAPVAKAVRYNTTSLPVTFRASDFNSACDDLTGQSLDWVKFTLPSSNAGTLYYNYTGLDGVNSQVRSSTNYYYSSSPSLGSVTFLPKAGYQGTVKIAYTGEDTKKNAFSGTVEIQVSAPATTSVFSDMNGYAWAASSVEFLRQNGVVTGVSATQYGPAQPITRGDFALMVCRAFHLNQTGSGGFSDVPSNSYYATAVETVKTLGIVQGDAQGNYRPKDPVSRQDAAVLLRGAMRAAGWSISDGSEAYLSSFQDSGNVASYARGAVASMIELNIYQGAGGGMLYPTNSLNRAEMAVTIHRALTL